MTSKPITLILASSGVGGTEEATRLLATGLSRRNHPLHLVAVAEKVHSYLDSNGNQAVLLPNLQSDGFKPSQVLRIAKDFRAYRHSLVNIQHPNFDFSLSLILGMRLGGIRSAIYTLHHPLVGRPSTAKATRPLLRRSDTVLVTTEPNKETLSRYGHSGKAQVKVCRLAVEDPNPITKSAARRELGIPEDGLVVSCQARFTKPKRIPLVVDAFKLATKDMPQSMLVIGGTGPEFESVKAYAEEQLGDKVRLLGWVEDKSHLHAACDAFVLLSDLEGFGMVYMEAASYGAPSIGCLGGGISDAIVDGETGYLVPVEAPVKQAAGRLREMLTNADTCRRLGENAKARYQSEFTIDEMTNRYLNLCEEHLKGSR